MESDVCPHANLPELCPKCQAAAPTPRANESLSGNPAVPAAAADVSDGETLLDDVRAFLARFVAFPSPAAAAAVALWAAHTHLTEAFVSTPRLALLSPEPGSGKTRTLEILELIVPRPMPAVNASPAAIFRSIEAMKPTLLLDEVDAIFGQRGKEENEDLRGLLNAGHRQGASIPRCVGASQEVRHFKVYAAVALAGLGDLPDTLMSRSVIVRMRRRAPGERVEPFRYRDHKAEGDWLRERLEGWAESVRVAVGDARPVMPEGVVDRPADVWEPLLAVADAAGRHWPSTARAACVELVKVAESREASLGVRLLADLRTVFGDRASLPTEVILNGLHAMLEAPWSDLRGKPIDTRKLARMLGGYGIQSIAVWFDGKTRRGYKREDLHDAWTRYLPPPVDPQGPQGGQDPCGQAQGEAASARAGEALTSDLAGIADLSLFGEPDASPDAGLADIAHLADPGGEAEPCSRCGWTVGSPDCDVRCGPARRGQGGFDGDAR